MKSKYTNMQGSFDLKIKQGFIILSGKILELFPPPSVSKEHFI